VLKFAESKSVRIVLAFPFEYSMIISLDIIRLVGADGQWIREPPLAHILLLIGQQSDRKCHHGWILREELAHQEFLPIMTGSDRNWNLVETEARRSNLSTGETNKLRWTPEWFSSDHDRSTSWKKVWLAKDEWSRLFGK